MREKLTEMRFHQLIMGLAGLFSSIETVNAASITDTTVWCKGTPTHLDQEGTARCHFASPQLPRGTFGNSKTNLHVRAMHWDLSSCRAYSPSFLSEVAVLQPQLAG